MITEDTELRSPQTASMPHQNSKPKLQVLEEEARFQQSNDEAR